jgi:hypothetical protein
MIIIVKRIMNPQTMETTIHNDEEGDNDHSDPGEEEGQTSVTDGNNNEEEDTDGEEDKLLS